MLKSYKDLKAWQQSHSLCLYVYKLTNGFPKQELYGMTAQTRRSAISIPSNIAEGYGRRTRPDYVRSLYIAYGSVCELETQMLLSRDLGYIQENDIKELQGKVGDVERMLKGLIKALENPRTLGPSDP